MRKINLNLNYDTQYKLIKKINYAHITIFDMFWISNEQFPSLIWNTSQINLVSPFSFFS
jgi:hypothetical protein